MTEDLLHFVWKHQKFSISPLKTTDNNEVVVLRQGCHNQDKAGPDFLNGQIVIGEQHWAGNIEIHLKSSDWYAHQHQGDANYTSVILHVVWEHDVEVFNAYNQVIPVVELSTYIPQEVLREYQYLRTNKKSWIPCANSLSLIDDFTWANWLERLFFERLEKKSITIEELLEKTGNNWEAVCFSMLAKSFGGNINGDDFLKTASSIPVSVFQKEKNILVLEALFMGQAGLLNDVLDVPYFNELEKEFSFLNHKYQLKKNPDVQMHFFKLRPPNFPTLRISQLANLYIRHNNLFKVLMDAHTVGDLYKILECRASEFWNTHYTFQKSSSKRIKKISKSFIDVLIINTVLPLRFIYGKYYNKFYEDDIILFYENLHAEQNTIINNFNEIGRIASNAKESQALIHLKKNYCDSVNCLNCNIGCKIIGISQSFS